MPSIRSTTGDAVARPVADEPPPSAPDLTRRGRATRRRILEAAADLIHRGGVTATRVDDVLAASAAGKSQFYHYFGNKDDLVAQVVEHEATRALDLQARALDDPDPWSGLRGWFDAILTEQREAGFVGGCPVGSIAAEVGDRDPALAARLAAFFDAQRRRLVAHLRRMQEDGHLNPGADPEALASLVLAATQGGRLLAATAKDERVLRSALEQAFAHLWTWRARGPG